jgi:hypothetical protein
MRDVRCRVARRYQMADHVAPVRAAAYGGRMPPLTGSPKQIAWATTIRARIVALLDDHQHKCEDIPMLQSGYGELLRMQVERQGRLFALIKMQDRASWWISRRSWTVEQLAAEVRANELA